MLMCLKYRNGGSLERLSPSLVSRIWNILEDPMAYVQNAAKNYAPKNLHINSNIKRIFCQPPTNFARDFNGDTRWPNRPVPHQILVGDNTIRIKCVAKVKPIFVIIFNNLLMEKQN
jgi:hypothetical protein